jgi:hypothetical protein
MCSRLQYLLLKISAFDVFTFAVFAAENLGV